tara:strand:- start:1105 stop:2196 length:1092 start_codon:yes stop_codon:yes gene_type:complete
MKLKTYICQSMDEALRKIRSELGDDAIIISSLNEGDSIRVTAACEHIPQNLDAPPKPQEPQYTALETKNTLCQMLSYHGVPTNISEDLISETCKLSQSILECGIGAVFKELYTFSPLKFSPKTTQPNQIMLAGPVGVGKTVTLAKIATEYRLLDKKVALISADYLKAGATEQIQAYATALEVPLTLVQTPTQLENLLSQGINGTTYLIDTPGTNPLNPSEISHLTDFILAAKQAPYLVLSAGADPYEMQETASAFKDLGSTRFFMTRFDAAKRFGGLLSILFKERLEFTAMSCGPEIGSRLKEAQSDNLVSILKAFLPDRAYQTQIQAQQTQIQAHQPTLSPQKAPEAELPAWVKGFMEAKKA